MAEETIVGVPKSEYLKSLKKGQGGYAPDTFKRVVSNIEEKEGSAAAEDFKRRSSSASVQVLKEKFPEETTPSSRPIEQPQEEQIDSKTTTPIDSSLPPAVVQQLNKPGVQETQPVNNSYSYTFLSPTPTSEYNIDSTKETLRKKADRTFYELQQAQFEQERKPTLKGAVKTTYLGMKGSTLAIGQGGVNFITYVKENPVESVLTAAALLTPIPGDEVIAGGNLLRTIREAYVTVQGTRYALDSSKRISSSPTPGATALEVVGETGAAAITYKALNEVVTNPVVQRTIVRGVQLPALTTQSVIGRGKGGTIKSVKSARSRRLSKPEIQKRNRGQVTMQQTKELGQMVTKRARKQYFQQQPKQTTYEYDIPSGKYTFYEKGGKSFLKKGKTILQAKKIQKKGKPFNFQSLKDTPKTLRNEPLNPRSEQVLAQLKTKQSNKLNVKNLPSKSDNFLPRSLESLKTVRPGLEQSSFSDLSGRGKGTDLSGSKPQLKYVEPPAEPTRGGFRKGQREKLLDRLNKAKVNRDLELEDINNRIETFIDSSISSSVDSASKNIIGTLPSNSVSSKPDSFINVKPTTKSLTGLAPFQVPIQESPVKLTTTPVIVQDSKPSSDVKESPETDYMLVVEPSSDVSTVNDVSSVQEPKPRLVIEPTTDSRIRRRSGESTPAPPIPIFEPEPNISPPGRNPPPPSPVSPPPPPRINNPFNPVIFPSLKFKPNLNQKNVGQPGFNVFVRVKGMFKQLDQNTYSRSEALNLGAYKVGTSAAATFYIEESRSPISSSFGGKGVLSDFYKKGKLFIEKRSRRIKSAGELQEITQKGLRAIKNKKLLGGN
jgi:hypothetical protein